MPTSTPSYDTYFSSISGLPFVELQYYDETGSASRARYYVTGYQDTETAVPDLIRAFITKPGYQLNREDDYQIDGEKVATTYHFFDKESRPCNLIVGNINHDHYVFNKAGIEQSKKIIQAENGLNYVPPLPEETGFSALLKKRAKVYLSIAPMNRAQFEKIKYSFNTTKDDEEIEKVIGIMGLQELSAKDLRAETLNTLPPDYFYDDNKHRKSYNFRMGDDWFIPMMTVLKGKKVHTCSGSTRGNEAYFFIPPALQNLTYHDFLEKIADLTQKMDTLDITDESKFLQFLCHELELMTSPTAKELDFLDENSVRVKVADLTRDNAAFLAGIKNIQWLLKTLEEDYGEKVAKHFFYSIDATKYHAFWSHDLHADLAVNMFLRSLNVTEIVESQTFTDTVKDCDDMQRILKSVKEFIEKGSIRGIPCSPAMSLENIFSADFCRYRIEITRQVIDWMKDDLFLKTDVNDQMAMRERAERIVLLDGFSVPLKDECSTYTQKNEAELPTDKTGEPVVTPRSVQACYFLRDFDAFCTTLKVTFSSEEKEHQFHYECLHKLWACTWEEYNQFLKKNGKTPWSEESFRARQKEFRSHLHDKKTTLKKADIAQSIREVCQAFEVKLTQELECQQFKAELYKNYAHLLKIFGSRDESTLERSKKMLTERDELPSIVDNIALLEVLIENQDRDIIIEKLIQYSLIQSPVSEMTKQNIEEFREILLQSMNSSTDTEQNITKADIIYYLIIHNVSKSPHIRQALGENATENNYLILKEKMRQAIQRHPIPENGLLKTIATLYKDNPTLDKLSHYLFLLKAGVLENEKYDHLRRVHALRQDNGLSPAKKCYRILEEKVKTFFGPSEENIRYYLGKASEAVSMKSTFSFFGDLTFEAQQELVFVRLVSAFRWETLKPEALKLLHDQWMNNSRREQDAKDFIHLSMKAMDGDTPDFYDLPELLHGIPRTHSWARSFVNSNSENIIKDFIDEVIPFLLEKHRDDKKNHLPNTPTHPAQGIQCQVTINSVAAQKGATTLLNTPCVAVGNQKNIDALYEIHSNTFRATLAERSLRKKLNTAFLSTYKNINTTLNTTLVATMPPLEQHNNALPKAGSNGGH